MLQVMAKADQWREGAKRRVEELRRRAPESVKELREKARQATVERIKEKVPFRRRQKEEPGAPKGPLVVLIHGLNVPRYVMTPMAWRLERSYRRQTLNVGYGWWFDDIPRTAKVVSDRLMALGLEEIDVVTHSMGGLVLRWAVNHYQMPRIRRAVLIAAPNSGCWLADHLEGKLGLGFPLIFGRGGLQCRQGDRGLTSLAGLLPGTEVGIIAGGTGTPQGKRNWFKHPGDTDGTIAVEETILPGMKDFILLNYDHTGIVLSSQTSHMVNLFLEHGVFRPKMGAGRHEH